MSIHTIQNYRPIIVIQVYTIFSRQLNGIINLHVNVIVLSPVPTPTVFIVVKLGFGRDFTTAGIEIYGNFIKFTLYFFFIITIRFYMDFYNNPIFVPRRN